MPVSLRSRNNTVSNAGDSVWVDIEVSPVKMVIHEENMVPGQSVSGVVTVKNTGTVDVYYFISASWYAGGFSTPVQATKLASYFDVTVSVPDIQWGGILYTGNLINLIDQPGDSGRLLTLEQMEDEVTFTFTLHPDTGASLMGITLITDLIFVAT